MEKYYKKQSPTNAPPPTIENDKNYGMPSSSKKGRVEVNLTDLPADPGLRNPISSYHPTDRDQVRRAYLQKGPCQPQDHKFPYTGCGQDKRRFNPIWFKDYGSWLEYSVEKDASFCLCCYLFGEETRYDAFITQGFKSRRKKERIENHVGGPNSVHNQAYEKCQNLLNQKQHIETIIVKQSSQARTEYRIRLKATLASVRFLLRQGLPFRGHDESEDSNNMGNFLELLQVLANQNKAIKRVVFENAPENLKLTSPKVQKDIVNAAAAETAQAIIYELGDAPFSLLVDESRDISIKEQMAIVIRYVDKRGCVIERFLAVEHVMDTKAQSLKVAIEAVFSKHGLSMSSLRGQGYDGAANMKGEFNGLQRLIQNENSTAFYVHCLAHQLQLALVAVAKDNKLIAAFFDSVSMVLNVVGGSCKRHDMLQNIQAAKVVDALNSSELESGRGLNQKTSLKRPGDTRWGSHFDTLINLIHMFSSVVDVLEIISDDNMSEHKGSATNLLCVLGDFDFAFKMHLMTDILGITNELSKLLQRKDQNIITAMELVRVSKQRLQMMRDDGWEPLLFEVHSFCDKYEILIPNISDMFVERKRSRRKAELTNLHHFRVNIFYVTIDLQLKELNRRFNVVNTELLLCVTCLDPRDLFSAFDKEKLIRLAQLYPNDFSDLDRARLDIQLATYIVDMRTNSNFVGVKGIGGLAQKMVETERDIAYPLIYLLLRLALTLPVATATVERVFSAMKIVKNRLHNRMEDEWMNDCLLAYIEKGIFNSIDDEAIMQRFQNMKNRRGQL
ncbi:zinc finger MYM-type protein 1-like protein [Cinnamomum micranthum f. kanehirae]|uniref:Zinc finger MYM-type protein 1-like protein n=1 Tax=Cinnamomum micranthum f. kanehirae TaxID=337451 RepID=A0A3S3MWK8_9MAGN|nr:zinc finger MYM-type protein 1-like protein [Cinnamomum micranthum f. kanehirae]